MGLRTRAIFLGVASYLASPLALALGLGEIKVTSLLNQPLEAEIQLLETRELSAQEILVGLGTREDFERVGIDRPFFLNDLKFSIDLDNKNGPVIYLKSERLVKEPYLNFIVQAQWPSGKLLREYTVLLDLPVFVDKPAAVVQAAKAQPSGVPPQEPAPKVQQSAVRSPSDDSRLSNSFAGDTYGPVASNDTLWAIASKTKPSADVTVQQTMLAIQRLNPNAFIKDNINLLKRGAVLKLPNLNDITEFDPSQARREVASQNQSLRDTSAQIDAGRSNVERGGVAPTLQGRVKLTSTPDATGSRSGSGSGEGEQDSNSLRSQLFSTQEELTSTRRENAELNSRVLALNEQVETMEKLLDVASADMRKLELALREQNALGESGAEVVGMVEKDSMDAMEEDPMATGEGDGETDIAVEPTGELASGEVSEKVEEESEVVPEVVVPETEEVKPTTEPLKPLVSPYSKKKSLVDLALENLVYIGGVLVLVIGGLVYYLLTRNRDFDDDDYEYDEEIDVNEKKAAPSIKQQPDKSEDLAIASTYRVEEETVVDKQDEVTLDSLESQLFSDSSANASDTVLDRNEEYESDFDELDTTLQFTAITEEDLAAARQRGQEQNLAQDDDTVLDRPDEKLELSLEDIDASLDLDLDTDLDDDFNDELEDLDADLASLSEEGSEPSEESVSDDLDFDSLDDDSEDESTLSLDLDDEDEVEELTLDLGEDDSLDDGTLEKSELSLDFDMSSEEDTLDIADDENDELDLSSLDNSSNSDDLVTLGDDLVDDELSLGDDLSLEAEGKELGDDKELSLDDDLDSLDEELNNLGSNFEGDLAKLDDALDTDSQTSTTVEPDGLTDSDSEELANGTYAPRIAAQLPDLDIESEDDSEPSFLVDSDEVATKIDLLRVFVDMGDTESALNTLEEIREEGTESQRKEAESLFAEIG
jgi:pilus assembly protein FimV